MTGSPPIYHRVAMSSRKVPSLRDDHDAKVTPDVRAPSPSWSLVFWGPFIIVIASPRVSPSASPRVNSAKQSRFAHLCLRGGDCFGALRAPRNDHRANDTKKKARAFRPGLAVFDRRFDQKSMPPPPGIGGAGGPFFGGASATIASVVIRRPAIDAAFCSAARTTLVGSMMPLVIRFT